MEAEIADKRASTQAGKEREGKGRGGNCQVGGRGEGEGCLASKLPYVPANMAMVEIAHLSFHGARNTAISSGQHW
jgi:hypothetical protein